MSTLIETPAASCVIEQWPQNGMKKKKCPFRELTTPLLSTTCVCLQRQIPFFLSRSFFPLRLHFPWSHYFCCEVPASPLIHLLPVSRDLSERTVGSTWSPGRCFESSKSASQQVSKGHHLSLFNCQIQKKWRGFSATIWPWCKPRSLTSDMMMMIIFYFCVCLFVCFVLFCFVFFFISFKHSFLSLLSISPHTHTHTHTQNGLRRSP